ncbi:MAG: RCC1 domain-containing protein, partial [Acidimicrobiales bacterium]
QAVGGAPPYHWALTKGSSLPAGLVLDPSTGVISGTPREAGTSPIVVEVSDSGEPPSIAESTSLPLLISPPVVPARAFGWGQIGQLGWIHATDNSVPTAVHLASTVVPVELAAGVDDTVVLASDGSVYDWGYDTDGELGSGQPVTTGHETASANPVLVALPPGVHATRIAAGGFTTFALAAGGSVYAWGYGADGQLGNGATANSDVPVEVQLPTGVSATAVAAGGTHALALSSTGTVYAWGSGSGGQLGNGTTANSDVPVEVQLPTGVSATAVAAGGAQSLALTTAGTVYAWGSGSDGQLGNGTTANSDVPVEVQLPAGVSATAVAAGGAQCLVATSTGAVLAWGANGSGQLGNGSTANSDVPVPVQLPPGVQIASVAAGAAHSLALTTAGAVYDWGYGSYGQLGIGTHASHDSPVAVPLPGGTRAISVAGGPATMASLAILATPPPPPSGSAYDQVAADGGVFSFGSAQYQGGMAGRQLNAPVVGIAAAPTGNGYWEVAADGGVFSFGSAQYQGGMAGRQLNAPVVGIAGPRRPVDPQGGLT